MPKDRQSLPSSIIEISSKDSVTKEVTMLIHKIDIANGNGLDFKEEYVEKFKDTLINKPVVAKYLPLSDDLGDHEPVFDTNGNIIRLETIAIGTIKDAWIEEFDTSSNVKALYAKADLWNYKYPEIITCVEKLFTSNNADSSVEVEIYSYGENPTQEYRFATDYTYIGNCLLGSNVPPADSDAGVLSVSQKEIANAVKIDLQNIKNEKKGERELAEKEVFNKGYETNFHGSLETSTLKFSEVRSQVYNLLNPVDVKNGSRSYNYYIRDMYIDYVIVEDWHDEVTLYKIPYSISNEQVILSPTEQWQKGYLGFIPEGVEIAQKEIEINKLQDQLTNAKEELSKMDEKKTKEVSELESKITELEAKITELNSTIVSQEEIKSTLEGKITELNSTVEDLNKYKEQSEATEKEAKLTELNSKYSKLIPEEVFKTEEVQNAIKELNSEKLNEIVVSEVAKQKLEIASASDSDVIVVASKQDDLIKQDILQKYGIN